MGRVGVGGGWEGREEGVGGGLEYGGRMRTGYSGRKKGGGGGIWGESKGCVCG
jgi:hypothetical protein